MLVLDANHLCEFGRASQLGGPLENFICWTGLDQYSPRFFPTRSSVHQ